MALDFEKHLIRQREFSVKAFGPDRSVLGVIDHIEREIDEVRDNPGDVTEWIDIVLLACDGAMRSGHSPATVSAALNEKLTINENRDWPDWRMADQDKAIEHIKAGKKQTGSASAAFTMTLAGAATLIAFFIATKVGFAVALGF